MDRIISKLRRADVDLGKGMKVPKVCKQLEITEQTYCRCRLERAAQFLQKEGTLTIRQIAEQIGFTTARYLATVFNERYHCTPQQFRGQVSPLRIIV